MALGFPFGFRVAGSEPLDNKYGPYNSVAAAIAAVVAGERYIGLTINVNGIEYWWKDATNDAALIIKTTQGGISIVQFDATLANIALDFGNDSEVTFVASAPIGAIRTWQLVNSANAKKMYILFSITGAAPETYAQTFPNNFKMNNPDWDKNNAWTPYQIGDYKATAIYDGVNWWMDIDGVYTKKSTD